MNPRIKVTMPEETLGMRLDKALSIALSKTRNHIEILFDEGHIWVNGKNEKPSYRVKENDVVEYEEKELVPSEMKKENIPLDIVYEDEDLMVINKPRGMVVHPANGHHEGTLVNALLGYCTDLSGINGVERPGIVHRIDKDTSGLLVVCKNDFAHNEIAKQLKDKTMHREYYALCKGVIKEDDGKIIAPIGRDPYDRLKMAVDVKNGKEAITFFHVEERFNQYTLVSVRLFTGRTHQIRVHMHYIGHPLEGDPLYGKKKNLLFQNGQLLHAYRITFIHPRTQKEMTFEVPLPDDFKAVLERLRK
ncbi:pseudouridine synthase [Coprobacillus sp. CAG:826]|nr:RluA family pseudouridine synthase [Coprobacillus sp.]CDD92643.1 pseudouridine synthase [Coprobacillus sp. CAG:826]